MATHASAPPAGPAPRRRRRGTSLSTYLLLGPGLAVLLAFFLAPLYYVLLMLPFMAYAVVLLGLNLLFGYTGLVSFGHALFIGISKT